MPKNLKAFLKTPVFCVLVSVLATLLGVETISAFLLFLDAKRNHVTIEYTKQLFESDKVLGYKLMPNVVVHSIARKNSRVIYNVTYTTDAYGRRMTPIERAAFRDHYLLFFGCSLTFGVGVNDNETLPFYVARLAPRYFPYNYGLGGAGPQQMLAKLEGESIVNEIHEKSGILIYPFINFHVNRAIGSTVLIYKWRGNPLPYYTLKGGQLVRRGNFGSGRPWLSKWYWLLEKSYFLKYFRISIPKIRDSHIRLTAKIIEESRNRYREKFGNQEFYVLFYPGSDKYASLLKPYLDKAKVKYLDYSNWIIKSNEPLWLGDRHPTPSAYQAIAERVVHDLGLSTM